jgi:glycosyltransferase involved in cell wall biosynthesis
MPKLWKSPRPDVLFTPSHYLPPLTLIPSVFTIHDLGYLKFSGQFKKYDFWQLKCWTAISVFISKYIIAVSDSTKQDIVRHYSFASKKVVIAHHGYDKTRFNDKINANDVRRVKKKYGISEKEFVLFLSTLKPSKNVEGLLKAYALISNFQFPISNGKIKLVIAGKKGWLYDSIFQRVKELNLGKNVIFTDFVSEKDKPALLFAAKVFVLPSFWEGFGMDVLNAMACGTPPVVSKVSSLPEVAGQAGIYVDPYNIESIAEGINKVLNMSKVEKA